MLLTASQCSLFFRALGAACSAQGINNNADRDIYRKSVVRSETGLSSLKLVNRTDEYEAIMLRLALDASDYELATHFSSGTERRLSHMVEVCAAQLMQLHPDHPDAQAYVIGIINQAGYRGKFDGAIWWLDLTSDSLMAVFQMLDTHRRRILRRAGYHPLTFYIGIQYFYHDGQLSAADHDYTTTLRPIQIAY